MRVTLRQVARHAGVSVASVSYAFSHSEEKRSKLSAFQRERILSVAAELGYTPSILARGLAESKSYTLALLLPARCANNLPTHYLGIFHGISYYLLNTEYTLSVYFGWSEKFTANIHGGRIDGVLCIARLCDAPVYHQLQELNLPVVLLNGLPQSLANQFSSVCSGLEAWLRRLLRQCVTRHIQTVRLYVQSPHTRLMDAQLVQAFPDNCQASSLKGEVYYEYTPEPTESESCFRLFRGETCHLRKWLANGMPGFPNAAVLLDPARADFLQIPKEICYVNDSQGIGEKGCKLLLQQLSPLPKRLHQQVPVLSRTSYTEPAVLDFDF